jgi:YVTN family beta-propeller protein
MSRTLLSALVVVAAGCHVTLNDPSTDAPLSQLYFPTGLRMDPGGKFLYVSNANVDLRYSGGTVQVIDLAKFQAQVDAYRQHFAAADPVPLDGGIASCTQYNSPAGQSSSCYPGALPGSEDPGTLSGCCVRDPLDGNVIDCDTPPFIDCGATVHVGNFAGTMRLLKTGDARERLFVGVRGDPSITWIDIDASSGTPVLSCAAGGAKTCDDAHVISACNQKPTSGQPAAECPHGQEATDDQLLLPGEPFGLALDRGSDDGAGLPYARLLVSHLTTGQVSLLTDVDTVPVLRDVSSAFFSPDPNGRHGAFELAPRNPTIGTTLWYLTSDTQPTISSFRVADANVIVPGLDATVSGPFSQGTDVRDIVFEPGGERAFLTENNPPTLVVMDTSIKPGISQGLPLNRVTEIIDICQTPSHLGVRRTLGPDGRFRTRVYVVCFLSNQVMVVDPDLPGVVDTVVVGRGPNDIVFDFPSDHAPGETVADEDAITPFDSHRRAYVSNFSDNSISVINLDPGDVDEDRVVSRIGIPVPPMTP